MLYLRQWLSFYHLICNIQKKKTRYLNIKNLHVRKMLAFDIETTGLDPDHSLVTVVCTEDFATGERRAYEFARVRACEPQNEDVLRLSSYKRLTRLRRSVPSTACALTSLFFTKHLVSLMPRQALGCLR